MLSLSLQAAPSAHAHHCYVLAPFALSFSLAASRVVAPPVLATAALALSPCVVSLSESLMFLLLVCLFCQDFKAQPSKQPDL